MRANERADSFFDRSGQKRRAGQTGAPAVDTDRKEIQLAKERYECEVYVTIGGSSRTNGFAEATSTKEMREKFASRVSRFLYEEYEEDVFDGVDLNWSYPRNETEWRNLGKFAKALKKDFREHDVTKKVSIAYYPNENQEQILEMLEVTEFADGVHAMAYDSDDRDGHSNMRRAMDALNFAQDSFTGGRLCDSGYRFTDARFRKVRERRQSGCRMGI